METKLTDSCVDAVAGCSQLRMLGLTNAVLTNKSAVVLAKLTALEELDLTGTSVQPAKLAQLRGALPKCTILPQ
mgnify:CR=1 FL=1